MGIYYNPTGAGDHVQDVEHNIRTIKECVRANWSRLPFRYNMPPAITIRLVKHVVMWLNSFPRKGGVSTTLSPQAIIWGQTLSSDVHCRAEFGDYVQTHEDNNPTNSMADRTLGAICLGPTRNA